VALEIAPGAQLAEASGSGAEGRTERRAPASRRLPPEEIWADDGASPGRADVAATVDTITRTLASFGVPVEVVDVEEGPTVVRLGVRPGLVERGGHMRRVRVARLVSLRDDLALALATPTVRIEAPVPGRPVVGIEVPNPTRRVVGMRRVLSDPAFRRVARTGRLPIPIGRTVAGEPLIVDLAAQPHLLVAGGTGSGKSVFLAAAVCALVARSTPDRLRLVVVDPKRVEFGCFDRLPHLLGPPVHDLAEAVAALRWLLAEIDGRYRRFAAARARDLEGLNRSLGAGHELPPVVVVIDELADLVLSSSEDLELLISRIGQLGRAAGVHLIVATQRPSSDVVTGLIKANLPGRVAFATASQTDSRVVLDRPGAEALAGHGDLLYASPDAAEPRRAQGVYVSEAEIRRLVDFWAGSHWPAPPARAPWAALIRDDDPEEALFARAADLAAKHERVTASFLQRRLRVSYRRARELYERLEEAGLVAEGRGADPSWADEEPRAVGGQAEGWDDEEL
jgi:S-DNA-T family DNA segregation ATPase FtsK/SpoIIIE